MTKLTLTLSALALLTAVSAHANEPWDKTDKALFAGFTAIRAVDMAQTLQIARNPDQYREATNPFLGQHPSPGKVVGTFLATHALIWLATDYMSPKARKIVYSIGIAFEGAVVGRNFSIGLTGRF
jgi:hypothetical protein